VEYHKANCIVVDFIFFCVWSWSEWYSLC